MNQIESVFRAVSREAWRFIVLWQNWLVGAVLVFAILVGIRLWAAHATAKLEAVFRRGVRLARPPAALDLGE